MAGMAAGLINTVVGSGTLITFPTLLALGYPPVLANISNNIGLVPGSLSGAIGYRRELAGQRRRLLTLGTASLLGSVVGAVLLLLLPDSAFEAVVPVLIALGCVMVLVQPRLQARLASRRTTGALPHGSAGVWGLVALTGVYGGYFGAAQGVLLIAVLGIGLDEQLQRVNAAKNVLATLVNGVAAGVFIVAAWLSYGQAAIDWQVVGLIAAGSAAGGVLGARVGRRIPAPIFRGLVVAVGVTAIVSLLS
ncbi:MAG TPA: sulfite exporter TauE/SafE family protein [Nocardioidaceae bacterium]|nr:sulfite exporter TauE/SafE family protein [Nocardioidaceae bacterium]